MHFDAITRILADNELLARLYAIFNIGELAVTLVLFAVASMNQRMGADIYQKLIALHFDKLSEGEARAIIAGKSRRQQWLGYIEIACFIILMISQVFTTWYILQP